MLIIFLILALIVVCGSVSLGSSPVIIEFFDYHIEISLMLVALILLTIFFTSYYLTYLLIFLKNIPTYFKKHYNEKHNREDLSLLLDGFCAVESGDINKTAWVVKRIDESHEQVKTLKPLFLLLSAQYYQATNCEEKLEQSYQDLLKFDNFKMIALKGLIEIRLNKKLYYDALPYAQKAFKLQPKTDWLLKALVEIYMELRQYNEAEQMIKKKASCNFISSDEANHLLVKNFIAMANQYINNSEQILAINTLEKALKLDPANYEAVNILARLYSQANNRKSAHKIIEKAWKKAPSLAIARLMLLLYRDSNVQKRVEVIEELIESAPNAKESYLVMAELCIDEDMIVNARAAMDKLLEVYAPDSHMSKLMALIEAKAQNNYSIIINWLKKL